MSETNAAPAAPSGAVTAVPATSGSPAGIGGWLILPVIGLVVTPLGGIAHLFQYGDLAETLPYLSRPQKLFLLFEIVGNIVVTIGLPVYLLVLLFRKRAAFPGIYTIWAIASLVFIVADLAAAGIVFADAFGEGGLELFDGETVRNIFRSVVLVAIWVPYMRMSKRVKNTFVT